MDKAWQAIVEERIRPLMDRLRELNARCQWESYVALNPDRPKKTDIVLQHWTTKNGTYIVRIYANGDGWDVFKPVTESIEIKPTLEAIV